MQAAPGGATERWARPTLRPEQLSSPNVHVVDADASKIRDLAHTHAAELEQWSEADDLSPTACAILAILSMFHGLRSGPDGCGVQWSVQKWTEAVGRCERSVQYAFDELLAAGYISRFRRYVKVEPWTDAGTKHRMPRKHRYADIHAVTYLTVRGRRRIARRGETRVRVKDATGEVLALRPCGVVGDLLKTLKPILRTIARRVTDAAKRCTPSLDSEAGGVSASPPQKHFSGEPSGDHHRSSERQPVENGTVSDGLHSRISRAGVAGPYGMEVEIERCIRLRITTAAQWHPDRWRTADAEGRLYLVTKFAPIAAGVTRFIQYETGKRERFGRVMALKRKHERGRHLAIAAEVWHNPDPEAF